MIPPEDHFRPRPSPKQSWDAVAPFPRFIWIRPNVPEDDFDRVCQKIWDEAKKATDILWSDTFEDSSPSTDNAAAQEEAGKGHGSPERPLSKRCTAPASNPTGRAEEPQDEANEVAVMVLHEFQSLISQNEQDKEGHQTDFTLPHPYLPGRNNAKHARVLSPVMETELERNEEEAEMKRKLERVMEEQTKIIENFIKERRVPESISSSRNEEHSALVHPFTAGKPLQPRHLATSQTPDSVSCVKLRESTSIPHHLHPTTEDHVLHLSNEEDFPPLPTQLHSRLSVCQSEDEPDIGSSLDSDFSNDSDVATLAGLRSLASDGSDTDLTDDSHVEESALRPHAQSAASCVSEDELPLNSPVRDFSCLPYTAIKETYQTSSNEADFISLPKPVVLAAENKIPPSLSKQMPITATSTPTKLPNITISEPDSLSSPSALGCDSEEDFPALTSEKDFPPLTPGKAGILPLPTAASELGKKHSYWAIPFPFNPPVPTAPLVANTTVPAPVQASVQGKAPVPQAKLKAKAPSPNPPPPAPTQQEAYDLLADFPALQPQKKPPSWSFLASRSSSARDTEGKRGLTHSPNQSQQHGASHQMRMENEPQDASPACSGDQKSMPITFGWGSLHSAPIINPEVLKANNQLPTGGTGADGSGVSASAWAAAAKVGMKQAAAPQEKPKPCSPAITTAKVTDRPQDAKAILCKATPVHQGAKPQRTAWCHGPRPQNLYCYVRPGYTCPPQHFGAQAHRANCPPGYNPLCFPFQQMGPHFYRGMAPGMTSHPDSMYGDGPKWPHHKLNSELVGTGVTAADVGSQRSMLNGQRRPV